MQTVINFPFFSLIFLSIIQNISHHVSSFSQSCRNIALSFFLNWIIVAYSLYNVSIRLFSYSCSHCFFSVSSFQYQYQKPRVFYLMENWFCLKALLINFRICRCNFYAYIQVSFFYSMLLAFLFFLFVATFTWSYVISIVRSIRVSSFSVLISNLLSSSFSSNNSFLSNIFFSICLQISFSFLMTACFFSLIFLFFNSVSKLGCKIIN